jgi:hypothetical protein
MTTSARQRIYTSLTDAIVDGRTFAAAVLDFGSVGMNLEVPGYDLPGTMDPDDGRKFDHCNRKTLFPGRSNLPSATRAARAR